MLLFASLRTAAWLGLLRRESALVGGGAVVAERFVALSDDLAEALLREALASGMHPAILEGDALA